MKILLINQDWFAKEFRDMGHEVLTCGFAEHLEHKTECFLVPIQDILKGLPNHFVPDAIVVHDNSSPVLIAGFEDLDIPTLFYSVDAHHHYALHRYLAHLFDYTLIAQKDYIPFFQEVGVTPEWFPLWASRQVEPSDEKKYGAVFVGSLDPNLNPDRVRFLEALKKKVKLDFMGGEWWRVFPYSQIVINQTVKGDLNFRVFEAMACRAMLLTERSGNGLFDLFSDGKHLVSYTKGNVYEAADLINQYLSDPSKCREIAVAGYEEIQSKHLPMHRAERASKILSSLKKSNTSMRYFGATKNFMHLGLTLEKRKDRIPALKSIHAGILLAYKGVKNGNHLTEEVARDIIIGTIIHDHLLSSSEGLNLLCTLADNYPVSKILEIAKIGLLEAQGRSGEAQVFAKRLHSAKPELVLTSAQTIVREVLAELSQP